MKVLYAASRSENSKIQLSRFAREMQSSPHIVKIAAYKIASPKDINIDWTLDSLLNIFKPNHISLENEPLQIYFDQVERYAPDLIISDMEYFTSYIANLLGIPVWQCGTSLLNLALTHDQKYNLGLFKQYYYLFHRIPMDYHRAIHMLDSSEKNLVYSHLCDTENPPILKEDFEWVRPYHILGKRSALCQHNMVAGMRKNNKKIFEFLQQFPDCVAFTEFPYEEYPNLILKDIDNEEEYACNLYNSSLFVCDGSTDFLADAFYNRVFSLVLPNITDKVCLINGVYSQNLKLSKTIYEITDDLDNNDIEISIDPNVKYLHERVNEL